MPTTLTTDKTHHVRIPNELSNELRRAAEREHNGVSAVIRRLLTAGLAGEAGSDGSHRKDGGR